MMDPIRHLALVSLVLSCALAAPQFAYTTTTFGRLGHPFVPLPFARVPYQEDLYTNNIQEEPTRVPVSPYHFIPATLPQAIYSEPAHILSGYSYQTLDPAGAKSQVLFVSGPNSQQLFRQNAGLLQIVLPSLFTSDNEDVIPRITPTQPAEVADNGGSPTSAESRSKEEHEVSEEEPKPSEEEPKPSEEEQKPSEEEQKPSEDEAKQTETSEVPEDTSKVETDKSSEETTSGPAEKEEEVKSDVSTSEASDAVKAVPPETGAVDSVSTEAPVTSTSVSEDKSVETTSEENKSEVKPSEEDHTTESVVISTTSAPAE